MGRRNPNPLEKKRHKGHNLMAGRDGSAGKGGRAGKRYVEGSRREARCSMLNPIFIPGHRR